MNGNFVSLKQRLKEDKPLFGTFVKLPRPEVVEVLALAGLDFIICDLEHSQMDEDGARAVILAGRAVGLPVVVRIPDIERGLINRLLEAGACGLQVPRVRNRDDVVRLRELVFYSPEGSRSISLTNPAAGYGLKPLAEYMAEVKDQVVLIGQFETAQIGDGPLEHALTGLDIAFIGLFDLSVDLGTPGRFDVPEVNEWLGRLERAAKAAQVVLGTFAPNPDYAWQAVAKGYRYIALESDLAILQRSFRNLLRAVKDFT